MKENNELTELKNDFDNIDVPVEIDFVIEKAIKDGKKHNKNKVIKNTSILAAGIAAFMLVSNIYPKLKHNNGDLVKTGSINQTEIKNAETAMKTDVDEKSRVAQTPQVTQDNIDMKSEFTVGNSEKNQKTNEDSVKMQQNKESNKVQITTQEDQVNVNQPQDEKTLTDSKNIDIDKTQSKMALMDSNDNNMTQKEVLPIVGNESKLNEVLAMQTKQNNKYGASKSNQIKDNTEANETSIPRVMTATPNNALQFDMKAGGTGKEDISKSDGSYVYRINAKSNDISITKQESDSEAKEISLISFPSNVKPKEFYIKGNYLLVIENTYTDEKNNGSGKVNTNTISYSEKTKIEIFDTENKNNPKKIREFQISGKYNTSAIIDNSLYVVDNQDINLENSKEKIEVPTYSDSNNEGKEESVSYEQILYCKDIIEHNYVNIISLSLENISEKMNVTSIIASGNNVYVKEKKLYIAKNIENNVTENGAINSNNKSQVNNIIYKFSIEKGKVEYISKSIEEVKASK